MIIQVDNPKTFLLAGGGGSRGKGQGYRARRGVDGEFRAIILINDRLYHPYRAL